MTKVLVRYNFNTPVEKNGAPCFCVSLFIFVVGNTVINNEVEYKISFNISTNL